MLALMLDEGTSPEHKLEAVRALLDSLPPQERLPLFEHKASERWAQGAVGEQQQQRRAFLQRLGGAAGLAAADRRPRCISAACRPWGPATNTAAPRFTSRSARRGPRW